MLIDVIFDITCPWSFIAKRWLERALAARPEIRAEITWRAFQLYPDMPPEGIDRDTYLIDKFGSMATGRKIYDYIASAGSAADIPFAFDRIRRMPNTRDAHRLIHFASTRGKATAAVDGVFEAYFIKTRDIGHAETLTQIAREIGLDPDDAAAFLASDDGIEQIAAEVDDARRAGFSVVPSLIFNRRHGVAGAHRPDILLPILDAAERDGPSGPG